MIIMVNQTKANFSHEFTIFVDGRLSYKGTSSPITSINDNTLTDRSGMLLYETYADTATSLMNLLPFKWLWSEKLSKVHVVLDGSREIVGKFQFVKSGYLKMHYAISYKDYNLKLYRYSYGSNIHLLLFHDDVQIGQYNKNNVVTNNLDMYTLYLLDKYLELAPILSLFTIYFDSYNYARRGEYVAYKVEKNWEWTYHQDNDKYDPQWLQLHF